MRPIRADLLSPDPVDSGKAGGAARHGVFSTPIRPMHTARASSGLPANGGRGNAIKPRSAWPPRARRKRGWSSVQVLCALLLCGAAAGLFIAAGFRHAPSVADIAVDAGADRHPISPGIYGVAYGTTAELRDLAAPLNRMGGNNTSRYNWKLNCDNRGSDWYFESIADASATPGERADSFIASSKAAGAQPMITIPTIGWVAKVGPNREKLASFSIAKYGPQTGSDSRWFPDAGNGILKSTGKPVTGNDPNDANVPADAAFEQTWIRHMVARWGPASKGGLRYYILDNEPSLWQETHRDVHPLGASMQEMLGKIETYSAMIKSVDPEAQIVAPEEWGWNGYFYSGEDQQYGKEHGWNDAHPDRSAHGGMDYLPWLLQSLHRYDQTRRERSLDVFSIHFYPQSGEFGADTSEQEELKRNRSTRALWDPNYVDESWIHQPVALIPRMKGWIRKYDPGLKLAITEYNWGAESSMNGAVAQADVLGIFGREGLDMAARWTTPSPATPAYKAMKLYRNYDGRGGAFGSESVRDTAPDPDSVSSFAALRKDGVLTVMVINKQLSDPAQVRLNLSHFRPEGTAAAWQLAANRIAKLPPVTVSAGSLTATLPPESMTLFVVPGKSAP